MNENTHPVSPEAAYESDVQRILATMPQPLTDDTQAAWLDGLSQRDRHLIVFEIFHGQVCNGGFEQWVGNGYHRELLSLLLLVLRRMEGHVTEAHRKVVLDCLSLTAATVANEGSASSRRHSLSEEAQEQLWAVDDRYFAFSEALKAEAVAYFTRWDG